MSVSGFGDIVSVLAFHDSIFQCAASLLTFSAISCFVVISLPFLLLLPVLLMLWLLQLLLLLLHSLLSLS